VRTAGQQGETLMIDYLQQLASWIGAPLLCYPLPFGVGVAREDAMNLLGHMDRALVGVGS
jgi:hypothetical protein